jgi:hypothetical protein
LAPIELSPTLTYCTPLQSRFWIGGYYLDEGNVDEALKNIRPCLALRLKLTKSDPGDLVAKYDLAWAYHELGIAL